MNIDKQAVKAKTKELASFMVERFSMNPVSCKLLNEAWEKEFPDEVAIAERMLALLDELECQQTFQQAFFRQFLMYDVVAEAYEEAKEQIAKDVEIKARLCLESNSLFDRLRAAEKHIAELEAREIKPAKGEVLVVVSGFTGCGKSAIAGEIEIAMKAIGVPVQWTNGDAEKHMTGADWLTAIEMYKPTVRIVEVNVPRAADIKVKGE
ncbi:hypothetical protein YJ91_004067 [Salmonella enterica subsp. enterica]|nr:hypothetical protein [Salmonella enterica subsp. enterica serovar Abony]EDT1794763.1 hypothetical protein [Salmonella enterica subsp. enterica]